MPKPLIGLTTTRLKRRATPPAFAANEPYTKSVENAGGIPVLIPSDLSDNDLEYIVDHTDGILFTGGYDLNPHLYGNPDHPKVEGIDVDRDRVEIFLVREMLRLGKPFLGICRGCQVIDVALGGSLYEDLPEQYPGTIDHDNHHLPRNFLAHPVNVLAHSRLSDLLNENRLQVNSLHHQGLNRLSPDLKVAARAPDDLVEAVELDAHPFGMAVQWHPEELQEYVPMRMLFQAFIKACQAKLIAVHEAGN